MPMSSDPWDQQHGVNQSRAASLDKRKSTGENGEKLIVEGIPIL